MQLIVGTYTEVLPHVTGTADGILVCDFGDVIEPPSHVTTIRNPSWIVLSRSAERLYSVIESDDPTTDYADGTPTGGIAAFKRNAVTGELSLLNVVSSRGAIPAHLILTPDERFAIVANYGGGSVCVFEIARDGRLEKLVDQALHFRGFDSQAHPHQIVFDVVSGAVFVPDVGLNTVLVYQLSPDGRLVEQTHARILLHPDAGPRHLTFHPDEKHLFVLNENDSTVCVYRRQKTGFEHVTTISTLPSDSCAQNTPSAIQVSEDGQHIYTANRGHDSISRFSFETSTSTIKFRECTSTRGTGPRDFILTSNPNRLVVANQDSNNIVSFARNSDGELCYLDSTPTPTPACLVVAN